MSVSWTEPYFGGNHDLIWIWVQPGPPPGESRISHDVVFTGDRERELLDRRRIRNDLERIAHEAITAPGEIIGKYQELLHVVVGSEIFDRLVVVGHWQDRMLIREQEVVSPADVKAGDLRILVPFRDPERREQLPHEAFMVLEIYFRLEESGEPQTRLVRNRIVGVSKFPVLRSGRKIVAETSLDREYALVLPPRESERIAVALGESDGCGHLEEVVAEPTNKFRTCNQRKNSEGLIPLSLHRASFGGHGTDGTRNPLSGHPEIVVRAVSSSSALGPIA